MQSLANRWSRSSLLKWCVKLVIAGGLLSLVFSHVPLQQVTARFSETRPLPLAAALLATLVARFVAAVQFKSLTDAQGMHVAMSRIFYINTVTAFYQLFLPGYVSGGAIRWYKLAAGSENGDKALSVILASRLFDTMVAVVWMLIFVAADTAVRVREYPALPTYVAATISAIGLSYICVMYQQRLGITLHHMMGEPDEARRGITRFINRVLRLLLNFTGLSVPQLLKTTVLLSLYHCLGALTWYYLAMGLGIEIPYYSALWIRIVVYLATLVPVSFSGIGVREGLLLMLLAPLGIASAGAVALAWSLLGISMAMGLLGGLVEAFVLTFGITVGRRPASSPSPEP